MMTQEEFRIILHKYLNGKASPAEERLIHTWYEKLGADREWSLTTQEEENLALEYRRTINHYIGRPARRKTNYFWYAAAAAIAGLIILVGTYQSPSPTQQQAIPAPIAAAEQTRLIENISAKTMNVSLEDGSTVLLYPEAQLRVVMPFKQSKRKLYLSGKAFFDVARDVQRPFEVYTHDVVTTVLGTSFLIQAGEKEEQITVAVKSGRVAVSAPSKAEKREIILTPNQQVVYNKTDEQVFLALVETPVPVVKPEVVRMMRFEDAPVPEVLLAMEKVYGVDISFDKEKLSRCAITTTLSGGGLYNKLDVICKAIGATYSVEGVEIIIESEGCN